MCFYCNPPTDSQPAVASLGRVSVYGGARIWTMSPVAGLVYPFILLSSANVNIPANWFLRGTKKIPGLLLISHLQLSLQFAPAASRPTIDVYSKSFHLPLPPFRSIDLCHFDYLVYWSWWVVVSSVDSISSSPFVHISERSVEQLDFCSNRRPKSWKEVVDSTTRTDVQRRPDLMNKESLFSEKSLFW